MLKLIHKRNNSNGFSLTELLVAVLILSMVSAVVAGGIPVAKDAYEKITKTSNAQVMLSTTITALRNELCTASDIEILSDTDIKYYSSSISNYSELHVDTSEDGKADTIMLVEFVEYDGTIPRALVSQATGDSDKDRLYVTFYGVDVTHKGYIVVKNISVKDSKKEYASLGELRIRLINES